VTQKPSKGVVRAGLCEVTQGNVYCVRKDGVLVLMSRKCCALQKRTNEGVRRTGGGETVCLSGSGSYPDESGCSSDTPPCCGADSPTGGGAAGGMSNRERKALNLPGKNAFVAMSDLLSTVEAYPYL